MSGAVAQFFSGPEPVAVYSGGEGWRHRIGRVVGHWIASLTEAVSGADVKVKPLDIVSPQWPAEMPPLRIAVLGDFHVGSPSMTVAKMRKVVADTNALQPDMILLAGDFSNQEKHTPLGVSSPFNGEVTPADLIARELGRLKAPGGVFAVLGNHDNYQPAIAQSLRASMEREGITVLHNQAVPVAVKGARFHMAGLADEWTAGSDMAPVRAQVRGEPYLLMAHNPVSFQKVEPEAGLMVAGHTHGGQVGIPLIGKLANSAVLNWLAKKLPDRQAPKWLSEHVLNPYGHRRDPEGREIYVTSGLGTSGVPFRANMPPEIALITLTGSKAANGNAPAPKPAAAAAASAPRPGLR